MMKERIDIEALAAWAYGTVRVQRAVGRARAMAAPAGMRSASASMVEYAALLTRVDVSPAGARLAAGGRELAGVPVDAAALHDAVMGLPAEAMALVVRHGAAGTRPDWHGKEAERLVPERHGDGRVRVDERGGRATACFVRPAVEPTLVAFSRAEYAAWWRALAVLREGLCDSLEVFAVTGPAADPHPWRAAEWRISAGARKALDDAARI